MEAAQFETTCFVSRTNYQSNLGFTLPHLSHQSTRWVCGSCFKKFSPKNKTASPFSIMSDCNMYIFGSFEVFKRATKPRPSPNNSATHLCVMTRNAGSAGCSGAGVVLHLCSVFFFLFFLKVVWVCALAPLEVLLLLLTEPISRWSSGGDGGSDQRWEGSGEGRPKGWDHST